MMNNEFHYSSVQPKVIFNSNTYFCSERYVAYIDRTHMEILGATQTLVELVDRSASD